VTNAAISCVIVVKC